jgi:hypothetical protein
MITDRGIDRFEKLGSVVVSSFCVIVTENAAGNSSNLALKI